MGQRRRRPRENPSEAAERQSLFREVNERIQQLGESFDLAEEPFHIVCECGNDGCHEMIELSESEYEQVRQNPERFAVLPGHEIPEVERIVGANDGFLIVEKVGEGGRIAAARDPRR
ncbi:MAG TPA: hypothetical protein VE088_04965 [Gaiellaceae bacterium]|jgi:hypothetical protein|nr:hypothetical protein [Gaiellaceae bacterium]